MRLVLCLCVLLWAGCGPRVFLERPSPEVRQQLNEPWTEQIRSVAKPGYWLVIRGYSGADNLVVAATHIPLSHAAIYDPERDQVIEAVGEGVQRLALADLVDKSHRVLVIEPRWWTPEAGHKAVEFARSKVGSKYDFGGILGTDQSDRWYCSELCVYAYREQHQAIDQLPKVIEPGQLFLWGKVLFDSLPRY